MQGLIQMLVIQLETHLIILLCVSIVNLFYFTITLFLTNSLASKNKRLLQLLEDSRGDATIENNDSISPIDMAGLENIRAAKLFFLNNEKYKKVMMENSYI